MGCPCGNAHSTRLALCRHFTVFAELLSLLFLVVSFQDEPVKVVKVGLYISACIVVCGEVDWYKANFRLKLKGKLSEFFCCCGTKFDI